MELEPEQASSQSSWQLRRTHAPLLSATLHLVRCIRHEPGAFMLGSQPSRLPPACDPPATGPTALGCGDEEKKDL
jgi:hypothetical protein